MCISKLSNTLTQWSHPKILSWVHFFFDLASASIDLFGWTISDLDVKEFHVLIKISILQVYVTATGEELTGSGAYRYYRKVTLKVCRLKEVRFNTGDICFMCVCCWQENGTAFRKSKKKSKAKKGKKGWRLDYRQASSVLLVLRSNVFFRHIFSSNFKVNPYVHPAIN